MTENFLDKVYGIRDPDTVRALYDDWAATYDAEIGENGYATPARCAAALATFLPDPATPILDFGCGTGLSGLALRALGFSVIDGTDLSDGMLETARARGVYRSLTRNEPNAPLDTLANRYNAIAAVGVISPGAGPPDLLDALVALLPTGGFLAFSLNDHALEDPAYEGRVQAVTEAGTVRIRFRDYGEHLPARGIGSLVCVLEKR
jgi:predicted TPR repeat methyltransferase